MGFDRDKAEEGNQATAAGAACGPGGCGAPGVCPGQALLISLLAGYGLQGLTGLEWVLPAVTIAGTVLLVCGLYRYLNPFRYLRRKSS